MFLMRLLITAAYGAYREELFKRIQIRENRTHLAFSTVFDIVTSRGQYGIELHEWLRLVEEVRPKFQMEVARAIFIAAEEEMEEEEEFEEDVVFAGIFVIGNMVRNPQAATAVPGVAPFEDVGGTGEGPSAAMFWVVLMEDVISFVDLVDFAEFGFRLK